MTTTDIEVLYYTSVCSDVMLHPYIHHMLSDINSGVTYVYQWMILVFYTLCLVVNSYLCVTVDKDFKTNGFTDSLTSSVEDMLYTGSLILLIVSILLAILILIKGLKSQQCTNGLRDTMALIANYEKTHYHTDLQVDKSHSIKFAKKVNWSRAKHQLLQNFEQIVILLAKVCILTLQFQDNKGGEIEPNLRDYILSAALIVVWWEFYRSLIWLTIIPDVIVVQGLVIQRCMYSILSIMKVAFIVGIPFILIFMKISIMDNRVIYKQIDEDDHHISEQLLFTLGHLYRIITMDSFHDYDFEDKHRVFFACLYPVAMSIFSLVVLNMCIAKLSIDYKDISDNAQLELTRNRLYIRMTWELHTIKSEFGIMRTCCTLAS